MPRERELASALLWNGALSVRCGIVDAIQLSGWRYGLFADDDAFTVFDESGALLRHGHLEGGVACLFRRDVDEQPLKLAELHAVRIVFPDAAKQDLRRRQLVAIDKQGQAQVLLEDEVLPLPAAPENSHDHGQLSPEDRSGSV